MTLSEVIRAHEIARVDLLKIDCEGAEEEALLGLSRRERVQQAVIESTSMDDCSASSISPGTA